MAVKAYAVQTDAELDAIIEEGRRNPKASATNAKYLSATDHIAVQFDNGIEIRFPRASIDGLAGATNEQLSNIVIEGGVGLAWPSISDDVAAYIPNMMDGFEVSCRVAAGLMGRRGGLKKSPAKAAAVRANGKKGGRPKKARPAA